MSVDIVLTASELAQRGTPYQPIRPAPTIYTHVGDARNHGTGRRLPIRLIIDHTTEGASTSILGSMRYDARRIEKVSCTAFTGEDGVGYDVAETNTPWTTGRWNDESLSNETVGRAEWSEQFWRTERSQTIGHKIDLFTDWCRRFNIPPVWLSAEQIAEGASLQGMQMRSGVNRGICDHLEANKAAILLGGDPAKYSHHDVGAGMRQILFGTIIPTVAARLGSSPAPPPLPTPTPIPVPPTSDEEDDMLDKVLVPKGDWVRENHPWLACFDSGLVRPLVSNDITPRNGNADVFDEGQYRRLAAWAHIPL